MKSNVIYVDFVSKTRRKFFFHNILRHLRNKIAEVFKKDKSVGFNDSSNHKKLL